MTDEVIGKHVGSYVLMEKLGSGGFGHVYKARHAHLPNRIVALKIFKETSDVETFLREARLLDQLRHASILSVIDVNIQREPLGRDLPYMVTEYAPGGSLRDRLNALPTLMESDEAVNIIAQIGEGLSYAHEKHIVHRDLKPENILFNAAGEALLADFGIAVVLSSGSRSSDFLGSVAYMAPEQFEGQVSRKSDQYALSCILYELVTGQTPFAEYKGPALAYQQVHGTPLPPRHFNPALSEWRERAILKALEKKREERYSDVVAFITALKTLPRDARRRQSTFAFEKPVIRRSRPMWDEEGPEQVEESDIRPVVERSSLLFEEPFPFVAEPNRRRSRRQQGEERSTRRYPSPHMPVIQRAHYHSSPETGRRQSWSDSFLRYGRQASRQMRRQQPDRGMQEEEESRRRSISSVRRARYGDEGYPPPRVSHGAVQQPRAYRKRWLRILAEPCCALILLLIAWKQLPGAEHSPHPTLILFSLLVVLIGLHAFFVGSSSERDRPLWGVVAWVTEVSFCVWCLFVLFVHSVDGVFGWFVWTILVSSLIASLYWWCYPLEE